MPDGSDRYAVAFGQSESMKPVTRLESEDVSS
jgi:hypothetical protein